MLLNYKNKKTPIINANPGLNPNLIYIGQKLLIIPRNSRSTELSGHMK